MRLDKNRSLRFGLSILTATAAVPAVLAQQADDRDDSRRMETIRVEGQTVDASASDIAVDFAEYGTQVQLISSDEIETGGFTNFGELASGLIRGANIGYSPDEGEFTIRIDGGTDRDTLLLVDGVPFFDRSSPLEDLWPATAIDPRMIEGVEVYRGGNSLYFGSNGGLGVVSVKTKRPDGTQKGQFGVYTGSFKTREIYGNMSFPLDKAGKHSILVYGRSYETDAHELFDEEAYGDNVLALGGRHEFPYSFNSLGMKYLWDIAPETELLLGASYTTIDFRDSFPQSTVFQPNFTEFPIYTAEFKHRFNDKLKLNIEGHYQDPQLKNNEIDARICQIPRLSDLPADIQTIAANQGISGFATATEFESFAAGISGLAAGCVTNPVGSAGSASDDGWNGGSSFYINQDPDSPFYGQPYGTQQNPFPIGAPIGYVVQSTASFGDGGLTKGFGTTDQRESGYVDYGLNARATYTVNEYVELVAGLQNTTYKDNSDASFGVKDVTLSSTGIYGDLRLSLPVLDGFSGSFAARQDFNDNFDDQSIWKVGLRQDFGYGLYARGSGGTSYSLPKIDEIGAFGSGANINPGLQPQEVSAFNVGAGIDGDIFGGTYNVEIGYFETEIKNLFSSRAIGAVCYEYANDIANPLFNNLTNDTASIERNRQNIVPPNDFCATAAAGLNDPDESVAVNAVAQQDIEGITLDVAFDFDKWQADFSFTDMESLEPNPVFGAMARLDGTTTDLGFVVPGHAGGSEYRQSSERPEWTLSGLVTYTPTDRWVFALNPRWQGPEWAYAGTSLARMVDEDGNRVVEDLNFGDYFVLNGSVQYFLGDEKQHRFLIRGVNLLDEEYYERASGGSGYSRDRAVVRGEVGPNDSAYYRQYGWNGKPRSFWIQYEYSF
ncbi:TonB-dependent receptor plug domain-containing protein [uncultured Hyphomonas sp.]|jgi:outer membrane receptor protein involved in Fe transport|uniref:TonB-dependent receptor plug domain-containing protein n=1 Tax=uncultured Hyphomonas sp. TaxID=225298 RepID=UPI000C3D8173|nr:TonB-dependent receptor [Hyphomonadaceae bacterium]MBL4878689.1 TonB-dependent receptor plug domain-containing protein [Hyphomonas sp.]|tara:strand:- start:43055 stop:45724 length:2670 start_codon:yes stop_codon:yes gene_type:complete